MWEVYPQIFWYGKKPDSDEIIRCYFEDLERMREVDPIKRKVLLFMLAEDVENEQLRISREVKGRRRLQSYKQTENDTSYSRAPLLRAAFDKLCLRLWPGLGSHEKRYKKAWLSKYSRHGYKWRKLRHISLALSLPHINANR